MSNQENILMMDGNGVMKDSNGNVIAKATVIKSAVISSTPSLEDLVKRIESLEKQLADVQKATSCELEAIRETRNEIISSSLAQLDYATSRLKQLFIK